MASAGVGHSREIDAFEAGRSAAAQALSAAGGVPSVTLVYGTVMHDHDQLLEGVRSVVGDGPLIGCSTQGISRPGGVDEVDRVVGVAVICGIGVRVAREEGLASDPEGVGRRLAEALGPDRADQPLLLWYDPVTGANVQALLDGLAAGGRRQIIGGGAGQRWGPIHRTYQFFGDEVLSDAAVALHLDGVQILHDLTHGTEPLGLELTVTGASDNVLREIDGQPALELWANHLGVIVENSVDNHSAWAMGVALPDEAAAHYEGPITRAIFGLDPENQSIILQAPIPTGTRVQLCHRTSGAVYDRALQMAQRLAERLGDTTPLLALSFECGARPRPFLGDQLAAQEVRAMQEILGDQLPWLGYYAWGEIAPIGDQSYFHNYTFPLAVLVSG